MKGRKVFAEIKKLKSRGLNKSQVQKAMNVNYKTVKPPLAYRQFFPPFFNPKSISLQPFCDSKKRSNPFSFYSDFLLL